MKIKMGRRMTWGVTLFAALLMVFTSLAFVPTATSGTGSGFGTPLGGSGLRAATGCAYPTQFSNASAQVTSGTAQVTIGTTSGDTLVVFGTSVSVGGSPTVTVGDDHLDSFTLQLYDAFNFAVLFSATTPSTPRRPWPHPGR